MDPSYWVCLSLLGSGVAMFGTSSSEDGLLMGRQNPVNQSFLCNTSQTFNTDDTNTGHTTNATLTVRDLRMQAFYFANSSTGDFDTGKSSSNMYYSAHTHTHTHTHTLTLFLPSNSSLVMQLLTVQIQPTRLCR